MRITDLLSKSSIELNLKASSKEEVIKKVVEKMTQTVNQMLENGLDTEHFERIRRKIYGDYVTEYNNVGNIARMSLADTMKQVQSFDYIEKFETVTKEYVEKILQEVFKEENKVLSIIEPNKE